MIWVFIVLLMAFAGFLAWLMLDVLSLHRAPRPPKRRRRP